MTKQLMTNIDGAVYQYITHLSKQEKVTKRKILEDAVKHYKGFLEQKKLDQAYKHMSNDEEYLQEMEENTQYLAYL